MRRWLLKFLWLTLIVLLLGCIFIWVRSYSVQDGIVHESLGKELSIASDGGRLWIAVLWGPDWRLSGGRWYRVIASPGKHYDAETNRFGFRYERGTGPSQGLEYRLICIPVWFITGLIAIPTLWLTWRRFRRRPTKGFPITPTASEAM